MNTRLSAPSPPTPPHPRHRLSGPGWGGGGRFPQLNRLGVRNGTAFLLWLHRPPKTQSSPKDYFSPFKASLSTSQVTLQSRTHSLAAAGRRGRRPGLGELKALQRPDGGGGGGVVLGRHPGGPGVFCREFTAHSTPPPPRSLTRAACDRQGWGHRAQPGS